MGCHLHIMVIGGTGRSLVNFRGPLLRRMVALGHRVTACAPADNPDVANELEAMGVTYRDLSIGRTGVNPVQDARTLAALFLLFRELRPDAVLSYTIKPVIWGGVAAQLAGVPRFYAMITGLGYAFLNGGGVRQRVVKRIVMVLYQIALRHVDAVFFQNPDDEAEFRALGLTPKGARFVRVNGSGVDLDHFKFHPPPTVPIFLLLARLLVDKGICEYREAARRLKRSYPQARFLIGGPHDSNPSAIGESEIADWVDAGEIEYLGNLKDVRPALARSMVFVLPSYREGTPRTVLEAMATGRAIITTDAPGCRETVVNGENGFLVAPRDVDALVDAMQRFLDEPNLAQKMGKRSLEMAVQKYDVHLVNDVLVRELGLDG